MKFLCVLAYFYIFGTVSSTVFNATEVDETVRRYKRLSFFEYSYLEEVLEELLEKSWEYDEVPCLQQLVGIIKNVQNSTLWATWIWDSIQTPTGQLYGSRLHLGNFDQCMNLPWEKHPDLRTQYCLAEVTLAEVVRDARYPDLFGSVQSHLKTKTKHGLRYNEFVWGVCVPAVCKPKSVAKFVDVLLSKTHLGQDQVNITVSPRFCRVAGERTERHFGYYFVWSFLTFFTIVTLAFTWYVSYGGANSTSAVLKIAKAFHIKSNAATLMETPDDYVGSLLGIRFLSVILTTGCHFWLLKMYFGISDASRLNKMIDSGMMAFLFNMELFVDTFLMLSGLLLINGLMHKGVKSFSPVKVIVKRYIRFMWPIILILMTLPYALTPENPGPNTNRFLKTELDSCTVNWWKVILMIANYSDSEKICYTILWSVSCDFHLSIVGVMIYWIYVRNHRAGVRVFGICAMASVVMPVVFAYVHNLPAVYAFDLVVSDNYRKRILANAAYSRSHLRAGAYFVGMALGFFISMYKPSKYRNVISTKSSILAFILFLTMFAVLNVKSFQYQGYYEGTRSALENALFTTFRRVIWAALVGFLILICEYGTLPLVTGFLSWPALVPLCKLSYGVSLTHFIILLRLLGESRSPHRHDLFEDVITSAGLTVVSLIASIFLWLFLEAPGVNLILMLFNKPEKVQQNGRMSIGNGHTVHTNGTANGEKKVS